ncbi:hypothetical protein FXF53_12435 [Micromonospora sp. WP24]|uniref:hypothetical protein n=1 Tax=Micromonospora sp. WP24 TaxID=2604469 RepID=UPI0011D66EB2|nr:hypothetical protein [Micromonospora sp. WP24]TYC01006.1 hypothetical protein FXF53_12435 [Micromonospora sp. WP24]
MDVDAQDRLRGRVLVGATVLALVVGGWWWRAAAPEDEQALGLAASVPGLAARAPGAAAPIAGLTARATDMRILPTDLDPGAVYEVDPATGALVGAEPGDRLVFRVEPDGSAFRVDPETGEVVRAEPGAGANGSGSGRYGGGRAATGGTNRPLYLPPTSDMLWQEMVTLTQQGVTRQVGSRQGARFRLLFRCAGPGELRIEISGGRSSGGNGSDCDGALRTQVVTGTGGPLRVSLAAADAEWVRIVAQLVRLG